MGSPGGTLKTDWHTPPWLAEHFRAYWRGEIPHDLATTPRNPLRAADYWTEVDDALDPERTWPPGFLNPPYGRGLRKWLERMTAEARRGWHATAILPAARWEQRYFQLALCEARHLCTVRKRVDFVNPQTGDAVSGNTYASIVLGFSTDTGRFRRAFGKLGAVYSLRSLEGPPLAAEKRRKKKP